MRIVEYKLEMKDNGEKNHPMWMLNGGYFPNEKTYIGVIPDEEDVDYFIPNDRFTVLTLEELVQRSIIEQNKPGSFNRLTTIEGMVLNDEGVTNYITEWWNSFV